jgi:hypothetical protein
MPMSTQINGKAASKMGKWLYRFKKRVFLSDSQRSLRYQATPDGRVHKSHQLGLTICALVP